MNIKARAEFFRSTAMAGALLTAGVAGQAGAQTQTHSFDIPSEPLSQSLKDFGRVSGRQIVFTEDLVRGATAPAVKGELTDKDVLARLLESTSLTATTTQGGTILIVRRPSDPAPQGAHDTVAPMPTPTRTSADNDGEVVVTAQRSSQRLIDVPLSVTAIAARDLIGRNQVSLDDYFRSVPGLTLSDDGSGFKTLIIRGISTGSGNTPTVGIYIDDTPVGSSTSAARGDSLVPDIDPSDLDQIEVLKGPQGTLYGASNMGGLLKYVTIAPNSTTYSGRIEVDGSSVDHGGAGYGVRAAVNLPLVSDQLALRLSASTREDPGYIDNVSTGKTDINSVDVDNYHAALRWTPRTDLTIDLSALFQDRAANGGSSEYYNFLTNQPSLGDLKTQQIPNSGTNEEIQQIYNAHVTWDWQGAKLVSSTSFANTAFHSVGDISQLFGPILQSITGDPDYGGVIVQKYGTQKFTQEFRVSGSTSNIDWLAGAFYTFEQSRYYQNPEARSIATGGPPTVVGPPYGGNFVNSHYYEDAVFGDVTYHFNASLSLQAGLRYSYNHQTDTSLATAGVFSGAAGQSSNASHESVPTFVVAPEWKITRDTTLYARVASGYRAGGPNYTFSSEATTSTFKSDSTINYEIGLKSYFLDHKLYVEASGYYITWDHVQIQGVTPLDEEFYLNAGGAVSRGVELYGQYKPIRDLTLSANFTSTDAHLTDNQALQYLVEARSGFRLPYTPRSAASASIEYSHPLSDRLQGTVGGDVSYQGDRLVGFQSISTPTDPIPPRVDLPSYAVVDLHAGVIFGRYTANLYVKNVADERALLYAGARTLSGSLDSYSASVIQPRTVGVSVAARF